MMRRSRIAFVLAALFTLANAAGVVYAGMMGEGRHAGLHVVLALAGAYVAWLVARRPRDDRGPAAAGTQSAEISSRLGNLERSLDAIAVEVERVGEGQRYVTNLFAERGEKKRGP